MSPLQNYFMNQMQGTNNMSKTIRLFAALAISTIAFAACSDSSGTGTGMLTVRLTDAPFPFSSVASVDVYVVRVDARKTATTEPATTDETNHDGWTTVATPDASINPINLLDFQNGKTLDLGGTTLPIGAYGSFRLILDTSKSSITLTDGTKPPIFFPSAGQTGIKVNLEEPVEVTEEGSTLILDFDIGRSFVMRGNTSASGFNFKPVINAVAQLTGSVSGSVHANSAAGAGVPNVAVEVLPAGSALDYSGAIVRSGTTDVDGKFTIAFLQAGTYELRATPPTTSGFKAALLTGGLTVTAGHATTDQVIVVAP
jgi:hypothetical protein